MNKLSWEIDQILNHEADYAFRLRAKIILSQVLKFGPKKILDLGCGRGFYCQAISRLAPEAVVTAVDINNRYLKEAQKNMAGRKIKFVKASAVNLPFRDNSFDLIIASELLEHIKNDQAVIGEIYRLLKTGGKAVISVPSKNYPFFWDPANWFLEKIIHCHLPSRIWWLGGIWADHVRLYSDEELERKITKGGLIIEESQKTTSYCLPFSHFLYYALGKNLVEKGWAKSLNRFGKNRQESFLAKLILATSDYFEQLNRQKCGQRYLNLIIIAAKKGFASPFGK